MGTWGKIIGGGGTGKENCGGVGSERWDKVAHGEGTGVLWGVEVGCVGGVGK